MSQLEVYVYDEREENLYVHHDLLLPAMPLCLEWLDFCPGRTDGDASDKGNFIAVGTMDPEIEIWSLDVVDGLYPDAILGPAPKDPNAPAPAPPVPEVVATLGGDGSKKKKKKKAKKPKVVANAEYHVDAILSLSWNRSHRNLLASSSADKTIKLWDLARPTSSPALRSFDSLHGDKVQSVQWNPKEPTVLLSGAWDGTVRVFDSRAPDSGVGTKVDSDVECLRWDPWEPASFLVSMENGTVQAFDSRMLAVAQDAASVKRGKSLWTLAAHDSSVSSLDINPLVKGCIVTGGTDNMVKVWNVQEQDGGKRHISLVTARDLGVVRPSLSLLSLSPSLSLSLSLELSLTISCSCARRARSSRLRSAPTTLRRSPSPAPRPTCRSGTRLRASPLSPSPFRPSRPSPSRTDARTSCPSRSNPGIRTVFGDRLRALGKDLNKSGAGIVGVADDDEGDMDSDDE